MAAKRKLTDTQLRLLLEKNGSFVASYRPGAKLIALGLIDSREDKFSNVKWEINNAGREFLRSLGFEG